MSSTSNHTSHAMRPSLVEAVQLEYLVVRGPGTHVGSESSRRMSARRSPRIATTSRWYRDQADLQIPLQFRRPLARQNITDSAGKPTIFRRLSTETLGCEQPLDFVPGPTDLISGYGALTCAHARVVRRTFAASVDVGGVGNSGSPRTARALSTSAPAPFRSYRSAACSAAARAPMVSPAAPNTIASVRHASP